MPDPAVTYSADRAKDLHDRALEVREDLAHVRDQLGVCLDAIDAGGDLAPIEETCASLAHKLREAADELDPER